MFMKQTHFLNILGKQKKTPNKQNSRVHSEQDFAGEWYGKSTLSYILVFEYP